MQKVSKKPKKSKNPKNAMNNPKPKSLKRKTNKKVKSNNKANHNSLVSKPSPKIKSQKSKHKESINNRQKSKGSKKAIIYPEVPESYLHALASSIDSGFQSSQYKSIGSESVLFSKLTVFSSIDETEQYSAGFRFGKLYHSKLHPLKLHKWYEDSIPELISFFQDLGLSASYMLNTHGNPEIRFSNPGIYVSHSMHAFEAGIISGFLSRAKGSYVTMRETECVFNKSQECVFKQEKMHAQSFEINTALKLFAKHLYKAHMGKFQTQNFKSAYNSIIFSEIKHQKIKTEAMHKLGELTNEEFGHSVTGSISYKMALPIIEIISAASSSNISKNSILLSFDPLNSDSKYLESLTAFIKGISRNSIDVKRGISETGLSYSLDLRFGKA